MHVLLIHCHPLSESFSAAIRDTAVAALTSAGHSVEVRNLYDEHFVPAMTAEQRSRFYDEASSLSGLEGHVAALHRADGLLLVYPTWWFGPPAMLKGWLDRVWIPGVAFHLGGPGELHPLLIKFVGSASSPLTTRRAGGSGSSAGRTNSWSGAG